MLQKVKNEIHFLKAMAANVKFGYPSKKISVIGVTGTDGKTTTCSLIYHILRQAGEKTAMISTVGAVINDKQYETGFHVTTPSPFTVQRYIYLAVRDGCKYLVLEATSHGLDQHRVYGVDFKIGVLTNITYEHLDYHKTYQNYVKAKLKLLQMAKTDLLNMDDQSYALVKPQLKNKKIITYSIQKDEADLNLKNFPFQTNLVGNFNLQNCLAAAGVALELGISKETVKQAILSFKNPPGRQEVVYDKDFKVIIDFAHTPNALNQILSSLAREKGRIIHVFGSAGERDKTKRPDMGSASAEYADIIILTAEDSRGESIEGINNQIKQGIGEEFCRIGLTADIEQKQSFKDGKKLLFEIPDRKQAIEFALSIAQKGDIILLTGKGHEKSMNLGNGEKPWDEKEVVLNLTNR